MSLDLSRPSTARRGAAAWIAAALACGILAFHGELKRLVTPTQEVTKSFLADASEGLDVLKTRCRVSGALDIADKIARLKPGSSAGLEFSFERPPGAHVSMSLTMYSGGVIANRLEVTPEGGDPFVVNDRTYRGSPPIDLTEHLGDATRFQIRLSGSLAAMDKQPRPFFRSLGLDMTSAVRLPPLAGLWGCLLCGWLTWRVGRQGMRWGDTASAAAAFGAFAAALIPCRIFDGSPLPPIPIGGLLVIMAASRRWARPRDGAGVDYSPLLLGAALFTGMLLREQAFNAAQGSQLEPDAKGYLSLANGMTSPYDSWYREPGMLWAMRCFFALTGNSAYHFRFMTYSFSVAAIALAWWIGRRLFEPAVGLAAALLIAANFPLASESARALRTELYTLATGIFLMLAWSSGRPPGWARTIGTGLSAGFMSLVVLSGLSLAAATMAAMWAAGRWKIGKAGVALGVCALVVLPHLLNNNRLYGDAFYTANMHARFYRNREFGGRPGFPTIPEIDADSYAGPPVTMLEYMFGLPDRSPAQVGAAFLKGWRKIFASSEAARLGVSGALLMLSFLLGAVVGLASAEGRWTLFFILLMTAPGAFLLGVNPSGDLWRLVAQAAPWMACLTAYGGLLVIRYSAAPDRRDAALPPDSADSNA